jgi:5-formyltetrahydrofolate cyclo-ligase
VTHAGPELDPRPDAVAAKATLRRTILARRDAVDPLDRARLSRSALDRIEAMDVFRRARGVLGFASFGSEMETGAFLQGVLASGRTLVLPRIDRDARRLVLHRVGGLETDLRPGPWRIPEPDPARCRLAAPADIDFILVPGVAFDPDGGRLGYGAGYYDRLLAAWPSPLPPLVAAAFEIQIVPAVPVLTGDHRVDLVVTESAVYDRRTTANPVRKA